MIPNEYLYYFYFATDTVTSIRESSLARGAYLLQSQGAFYERNGEDAAQALDAWRETRAERDRTYMAAERSAAGVEADHDDGGESGGYEGEAMAVVEAIANNTRAVMILNTANRSALPFLDERAVVEVPAIVGRSGPVPVAVGPTPAHAQSLVSAIKDVERTTIEAALTGSSELAVRALALHPLVPSVTVARRIFAGYRERLPELQERFAA
jgi:6-phospho-beta-glucosidase